MINDEFGQQIYSEQDLCDLFMTNPDIKLKNVLIDSAISFNNNLNLSYVPTLVEYTTEAMSVENFDKIQQNTWHIPDEYLNFDIAKFVLDQCSSEEELQRAGEELLLYQERGMFIVLKYLKYLVDLMRKNNILWGVGRGSSVSSFVLYLIGVHKINSLYYDLSIDEFLK